MKTRTLPGEKYAKARAWCDQHPSILPVGSKWRVMHKETLYAFLEGNGVRWSSARKAWYLTGSKADPVRVRQNGFSSGAPLSKRVSVRITASTEIMETVIAEFTELCEALDWHVQVSPKRYPNGDDGYERAYIEVIRQRV